MTMAARDPDSVVRRLAAGDPCFSFGIRNARSPDIVRIAASCGYDVLWIDLEHSTMSLDAASAMAMVARDLGVAAWTRIPEGSLGQVGQLLDGGAAGIIVPHIATATDAEAAVAACRYPPRGGRSQNALLPQFGFARLPAEERLQRANSATVVQLLIETPEGVGKIEQIACVDGVDIIALGLNDLSAAVGRPGRVRDPEILSMCRHAIAAARSYGRPLVVGGVADTDHFGELLEMGVAPLVFAGIDTEALAETLAARMTIWKRAVAAPPA
jgi:2-keto-3-deoxy-L-rhamnonate aldolase RhmA